MARTDAELNAEAWASHQRAEEAKRETQLAERSTVLIIAKAFVAIVGLICAAVVACEAIG